ncbi:MAG: ribosome maturation factor RimP [Candidatus Omnitrophica bacterium]|nr:ribosome maturation factor RimP [Candidatus Omnitrophota bacterium]
MLTDIISQVERIVLPLMADAGLELVDLIIVQRNSTYMIEVLTDRPQGGITLEECAAINKQIAQALDSTQPWSDDYELTVASPGLDRHLKNRKDFTRMLGRRVKFLLTEKGDGKGEYSGLVKEVGESSVVISVRKHDICIAYDKIMKAVLII